MLARRAYTNYYPHHALSRSVELSEPPVSGVCGMRDASTDQDVRLRVSRHEFSITIAYRGSRSERASSRVRTTHDEQTVARPRTRDLFLLTMLPSERAAAEFCQVWNRAVSRTHNLRISHGTRQSHTLRAYCVPGVRSAVSGVRSAVSGVRSAVASGESYCMPSSSSCPTTLLAFLE